MPLFGLLHKYHLLELPISRCAAFAMYLRMPIANMVARLWTKFSVCLCMFEFSVFLLYVYVYEVFLIGTCERYRESSHLGVTAWVGRTADS